MADGHRHPCIDRGFALKWGDSRDHFDERFLNHIHGERLISPAERHRLTDSTIEPPLEERFERPGIAPTDPTAECSRNLIRGSGWR